MRCLVNEIIEGCLSKKKTAEVINRYLRIKHNIYMDLKSVNQRINAIKMKYKFS